MNKHTVHCACSVLFFCISILFNVVCFSTAFGNTGDEASFLLSSMSQFHRFRWAPVKAAFEETGLQSGEGVFDLADADVIFFNLERGTLLRIDILESNDIAPDAANRVKAYLVYMDAGDDVSSYSRALVPLPLIEHSGAWYARSPYEFDAEAALSFEGDPSEEITVRISREVTLNRENRWPLIEKKAREWFDENESASFPDLPAVHDPAILQFQEKILSYLPFDISLITDPDVKHAADAYRRLIYFSELSFLKTSKSGMTEEHLLKPESIDGKKENAGTESTHVQNDDDPYCRMNRTATFFLDRAGILNINTRLLYDDLPETIHQSYTLDVLVNGGFSERLSFETIPEKLTQEASSVSLYGYPKFSLKRIAKGLLGRDDCCEMLRNENDRLIGRKRTRSLPVGPGRHVITLISDHELLVNVELEFTPEFATEKDIPIQKQRARFLAAIDAVNSENLTVRDAAVAEILKGYAASEYGDDFTAAQNFFNNVRNIFDSFKEYFDQSTIQTVRAWILRQEARISRKAGRLPESNRFYEEAAEHLETLFSGNEQIDATGPPSLFLYKRIIKEWAQSEMDQQAFLTAENLLKKLLMHFPGDAEALLMLAGLLEDSRFMHGRNCEALSYYRKVLRINPYDREAGLGYMRFWRNNAYWASAESPGRKTRLKTLTTADPYEFGKSVFDDDDDAETAELIDNYRSEFLYRRIVPGVDYAVDPAGMIPASNFRSVPVSFFVSAENTEKTELKIYTDGRLYRIFPLDMSAVDMNRSAEIETSFPHSIAVFRCELSPSSPDAGIYVNLPVKAETDAGGQEEAPAFRKIRRYIELPANREEALEYWINDLNSGLLFRGLLHWLPIPGKYDDSLKKMRINFAFDDAEPSAVYILNDPCDSPVKTSSGFLLNIPESARKLRIWSDENNGCTAFIHGQYRLKRINEVFPFFDCFESKTAESVINFDHSDEIEKFISGIWELRESASPGKNQPWILNEQTEDYVQMLRKATEHLSSGNLDSTEALLIRTTRGLIFSILGFHDRALQILESITPPGDKDCLAYRFHSLARAEAEYGSGNEDAFYEISQSLLEQGICDRRTIRNMVSYLTDSKRYENALNLMSKLDHTNDDFFDYQRGRCLWGLGYEKEAFARLDSIEPHSEFFDLSRYYKACCLVRQGKVDSAADLLEKLQSSEEIEPVRRALYLKNDLDRIGTGNFNFEELISSPPTYATAETLFQAARFNEKWFYKSMNPRYASIPDDQASCSGGTLQLRVKNDPGAYEYYSIDEQHNLEMILQGPTDLKLYVRPHVRPKETNELIKYTKLIITDQSADSPARIREIPLAVSKPALTVYYEDIEGILPGERQTVHYSIGPGTHTVKMRFFMGDGAVLPMIQSPSHHEPLLGGIDASILYAAAEEHFVALKASPLRSLRLAQARLSFGRITDESPALNPELFETNDALYSESVLTAAYCSLSLNQPDEARRILAIYDDLPDEHKNDWCDNLYYKILSELSENREAVSFVFSSKIRGFDGLPRFLDAAEYCRFKAETVKQKTMDYWAVRSVTLYQRILDNIPDLRHALDGRSAAIGMTDWHHINGLSSQPGFENINTIYDPSIYLSFLLDDALIPSSNGKPIYLFPHNPVKFKLGADDTLRMKLLLSALSRHEPVAYIEQPYVLKIRVNDEKSFSVEIPPGAFLEYELPPFSRGEYDLELLLHKTDSDAPLRISIFTDRQIAPQSEKQTASGDQWFPFYPYREFRYHLTKKDKPIKAVVFGPGMLRIESMPFCADEDSFNSYEKYLQMSGHNPQNHQYNFTIEAVGRKTSNVTKKEFSLPVRTRFDAMGNLTFIDSWNSLILLPYEEIYELSITSENEDVPLGVRLYGLKEEKRITRQKSYVLREATDEEKRPAALPKSDASIIAALPNAADTGLKYQAGGTLEIGMSFLNRAWNEDSFDIISDDQQTQLGIEARYLKRFEGKGFFLKSEFGAYNMNEDYSPLFRLYNRAALNSDLYRLRFQAFLKGHMQKVEDDDQFSVYFESLAKRSFEPSPAIRLIPTAGIFLNRSSLSPEEAKEITEPLDPRLYSRLFYTHKQGLLLEHDFLWMPFNDLHFYFETGLRQSSRAGVSKLGPFRYRTGMRALYRNLFTDVHYQHQRYSEYDGFKQKDSKRAALSLTWYPWLKLKNILAVDVQNRYYFSSKTNVFQFGISWRISAGRLFRDDDPYSVFFENILASQVKEK